MTFRTTGSWADLSYVNYAGPVDRGWEQLLFVTAALRKIAAFEDAVPIETTVSIASCWSTPSVARLQDCNDEQPEYGASARWICLSKT